MCFSKMSPMKIKVKVIFTIEQARWGWVVNVKPRPFYPRERPGTNCIGGWGEGGAGSVWKGVETFPSNGIRSPDRPARSESWYKLRYHDQLPCRYQSKIQSCLFMCRRVLELQWPFMDAVGACSRLVLSLSLRKGTSFRNTFHAFVNCQNLFDASTSACNIGLYVTKRT
jgi:hypothetical protein